MNSSITNSITKERDDAKKQLAAAQKSLIDKGLLIEKLQQEKQQAEQELDAIKKHFSSFLPVTVNDNKQEGL